MAVLPTLFVSHGSPMTALQPGLLHTRLQELAAAMPRPRAIVVATAHWLTDAPAAGGADRPGTVHDFAGFPRQLYTLRYPAPGAPALAAQIVDRLRAAGFAANVAPEQGLDHGVWVPLRLLYPSADIPVVPLAIQPAAGTAHHLALGRALAPLRAEGVLVIGSGSITHNLGDLRGGYGADREAPYVRPFTGWIEDRLHAGDHQALVDYRRRAPFAQRAHPTDEHLLPLFVALGAAGETARAERIDAGVDLGILAMDVYRFDEATPASS